MATKITQLGVMAVPSQPQTFPDRTAAAVTIDGETSIKLTMQYGNVMIGSDFANSKWDIL
jgi:hypothetical protein